MTENIDNTIIVFFTDHDKRLHRDNDLPAIVCRNGTKHWFKHGVLHRANGPAVIYPEVSYHEGNGRRAASYGCEWWYEGKKYSGYTSWAKEALKLDKTLLIIKECHNYAVEEAGHFRNKEGGVNLHAHQRYTDKYLKKMKEMGVDPKDLYWHNN